MSRFTDYDIEAEELFREDQHERRHTGMAMVDPRDPAYDGCDGSCAEGAI